MYVISSKGNEFAKAQNTSSKQDDERDGDSLIRVIIENDDHRGQEGTVVLATVDDEEDNEEEKLIRSMFLPRTESIGSEKDLVDDDVVWLGELQDQKLRELDVQSGITTSYIGLKQIEKQLKGAEKDFLSSSGVRSSGLTEEELLKRFSSSDVPENPVLELGDAGKSVYRYMDNLINSAVVDSVNTASPQMIGHMTSSLPYFMRPLSRLLTTLNQNCVKTETANTMTFLEREAMAQLHRQLYRESDEFYREYGQNPKVVLGVFTSGGTLANVTALWAARNRCLGADAKSEFAGIEKEGLYTAVKHYGYNGVALIGSKLLHYSMSKAAGVLGFGTGSLVSVPYGRDFRVDTVAFELAIKDCIKRNVLIVAVLGIAGATETGSIDDLDELATLANKYGIHFHVDAAWGGPCIFSSQHRKLLRGIERADSVTLDGHKQLYMPMGCGLCFFRDPSTSLTVRKTAKYIIRNDSYDLGKFTLEGSRPANAVFLHSNLNIFGVRGYEILVDRSIRMVRFMASRLSKSRGFFELVVEPMTNILLYRIISPELKGYKEYTPQENAELDSLNIEIQKRQTLEGKTFVSRTTVYSPVYEYPITALRVVIANPLSCEADIDRVLQNQIDLLCEMYPSLQGKSRPCFVQEEEQQAAQKAHLDELKHFPENSKKSSVEPSIQGQQRVAPSR